MNFLAEVLFDMWILSRLRYPALRVPPAETRLTVYRRLSVFLQEQFFEGRALHSPLFSFFFDLQFVIEIALRGPGVTFALFGFFPKA